MKDPVLEKIKDLVNESLKGKLDRVMLFGSRARGDFNQDSDYDLLIVLNQKPDRESYLKFFSELKTKFAKNKIPNDFLIRSVSELNTFNEIPGTTTYNALKEGIVL